LQKASAYGKINKKGRRSLMKIGNTELRHGLFLAPMAGYTDRAMRLIAHEYGAEYTVTEMVSATAVLFGDKKTFSLAKILPDEGAVAGQIFGNDPSVMAEATRRLSYPEEGVRPIAIDINMGCPVKKIFSNGEGSALMRDPRLIERITEAVRLSTDLPVTVKMRAGISTETINAVECARAAEAGGAALVCLHGRTREQMYGGRADRRVIAEVKRAIKIPLVANGDVTDSESALALLSETGADGIAVGRGAVGNPFIFREIIEAIEGKEPTKVTAKERVSTAIKQLEYAVEDKGERVAIPEARKQIALYFKGFSGAASARAKINAATEFAEVRRILSSLIEEEDV
jgi:nifR3 family TIM-barrel protein